MLHVAFVLYLINVAVGLLAQTTRIRFGRAHHFLYAVVFMAAAGAMWAERAPSLWLTLGALAIFPRARPRTALHPLLAALGLAGYLVTYLDV